MATFTAQPDSAGIDNYLYSTSTSANYGAATTIKVASPYVGLMAANVSSIPTGATVSDASITLMTTTTATSGTFYLAPIIVSWGEGYQNGANATYAESNWTSRGSGLNWPTAGCSGASTSGTSWVGSNVVFTSGQTYTFTGQSVAGAFQAWASSPSTNYGLKVVSISGSPVFGSSDNGTVANRPTWSATYSLGGAFPLLLAMNGEC